MREAFTETSIAVSQKKKQQIIKGQAQKQLVKPKANYMQAMAACIKA
jgi:hypothetical protein